jgi:yeast amino acid transporter
MLTWISILTAHISFRRACKAQGLPNSQLPYSAPFGVWGSSIALLFIGILIITKGVEVFIHGFGYKNFIVQYIGLPVYLISIFAYKSYYRTRRVRAGFADLVTGVPAETIAEEKVRLRELQAREEDAMGSVRSTWRKIYRRCLSWLF